jgi:hypothetical protein
VNTESIRRAAYVLRGRAGNATDGGHGWRVADLPGANEVWADRDAAGHDAFMVATTATRINPNPGVTGAADAIYIASMHPEVGRRLADWLDAAADWREENPAELPDGPDQEVGDPAFELALAYLGGAA